MKNKFNIPVVNSIIIGNSILKSYFFRTRYIGLKIFGFKLNKIYLHRK